MINPIKDCILTDIQNEVINDLILPVRNTVFHNRFDFSSNRHFLQAWGYSKEHDVLLHTLRHAYQ